MKKGNTFIYLVISILIYSCSEDITVETGENFEMVELPDASIVYLNKNSKVSYKDGFNPRVVQLEGEAFFSVEPSDRIFIIETENCNIEVLGTELNVKANSEETEVEVEEGEVEMKTNKNAIRINKGEKANYKTGKKINKGKADFKFRIWMKELRVELRKLGRDVKKGSKKAGKDLNDAGKELEKGLRKLKKK